MDKIRKALDCIRLVASKVVDRSVNWLVKSYKKRDLALFLLIWLAIGSIGLISYILRLFF